MTEPLPESFATLRQELLRQAPDLATLHHAGEQIAELTTRARREGGIPLQKIALLGSLTADFLAKAIACAVVMEGVLPQIYVAPFGSYLQQVLDRSSALHSFKPDLVILVPDARELIGDFPLDTPREAVDASLSACVRQFEAMWTVLGELGARIIQATLVPPQRHLRGVADRLLMLSPRRQVQALNERLVEAGCGRVNWLELDALATHLGEHRFADESGFINARLPFALKHLPEIIFPFRAAWRLSQARVKKVLVLDLDNTMWGGVIGDDGVEGIVIGPGSSRGEAFLAWNHYVRQLSQRGVILAVCSKNDSEIAATGFTHPHAIFARSDFAAFHCSWSDKASGMRQIASELNVGIDSFVFVDDNPAECEQVRNALPEIAVVHLGTDPTRFIERLDKGHWFDLDHYTAEDATRSQAYAARAAASAEAADMSDLSSYLAGLAMVGHFAEAEDKDLARIAQLEYKTNQFNLTTRRYSEGDIAAFAKSPDRRVFTLRLKDKFGDHGLVSSLVTQIEPEGLRIDSWLMSCRVFARTVEQFIMNKLVDFALAQGQGAIFGEYRPSPKNEVVAGLYERLNFVPYGRGWRLNLAERPAALEHFIKEEG